MKKPFKSQRLLIPKIILYFFLLLALFFLILTPFSIVTRVLTGEDNRFGFSLLIGIPLIAVLYIFKNYTIKIIDKKVTVYFPLGIKWNTIYLNEITHYSLTKIDLYEDGSPTRYSILILFINDKKIIKISSYCYWNSTELFEKLISGLNRNVIKIKK